MFDFSKHFARRVSISRRQGILRITIRRRNDYRSHIAGLVCCGALFLVLFAVSVRASFHAWLSADSRDLPLAAGFGSLFCFSLCLYETWAAFGTEEIVVRDRALYSTKRALGWTRSFQAEQSEITTVAAGRRRLEDNNYVDIVCHERTHRIGEKILREESHQIAEAIKHALGIHS